DMAVHHSPVNKWMDGSNVRLVLHQQGNLPVVHRCIDRVEVSATLAKRTLPPQGVRLDGKVEGKVHFYGWSHGKAQLTGRYTAVRDEFLRIRNCQRSADLHTERK